MKTLGFIAIPVAVIIGIGLMSNNESIPSEDNFVVENHKDDKQEVSVLLTPDQLWEQQHTPLLQSVEPTLSVIPNAISTPELEEVLPDKPLSLEEQSYMNTFIEGKESSSVTLDTLDESQEPQLYYVDDPELDPLPEGLSLQEAQSLADQKNNTSPSFSGQIPSEYPEEMEDNSEALSNIEEMHSDNDVNIAKSTSFMQHGNELEPIATDFDSYIDPLSNESRENETQAESLNNANVIPLESPIIDDAKLNNELPEN